MDTVHICSSRTNLKKHICLCSHACRCQRSIVVYSYCPYIIFQDFYSEINRKELYLRYVYKLSELHRACDNYTEAGYTLRQHADLLRWTSDPLSTALRSPHHRTIDRHGELKEKLYEDIISYFDRGKVRLNLCWLVQKLGSFCWNVICFQELVHST